MLVEMRRSAVLRRLGQVRGQLGLWQVQDGSREKNVQSIPDYSWASVSLHCTPETEVEHTGCKLDTGLFAVFRNCFMI